MESFVDTNDPGETMVRANDVDIADILSANINYVNL